MAKSKKYSNRTRRKRNFAEQKQENKQKVTPLEKRLAVGNINTVSVTHDRSTGKCNVCDAKGKVIVEENDVNKVTLDFAKGRVTFATNSSMLLAYDLNTGNQIISARYNAGTLEQEG